MSDIIFADGIRLTNPNPKAPDFVKAKVSIRVETFVEFLKKYEKNGWVNLNLKKGKSGNLYLDLDTWQPDTAKAFTKDTEETPPFPEF